MRSARFGKKDGNRGSRGGPLHGRSSIKPRRFVVFIIIAVICAIAVSYRVTPTPTGPIYSPLQLGRGLLSHPHAWAGRTVWVRAFGTLQAGLSSAERVAGGGGKDYVTLDEFSPFGPQGGPGFLVQVATTNPRYISLLWARQIAASVPALQWVYGRKQGIYRVYIPPYPQRGKGPSWLILE